MSVHLLFISLYFSSGRTTLQYEVMTIRIDSPLVLICPEVSSGNVIIKYDILNYVAS